MGVRASLCGQGLVEHGGITVEGGASGGDSIESDHLGSFGCVRGQFPFGCEALHRPCSGQGFGCCSGGHGDGNGGVVRAASQGVFFWCSSAPGRTGSKRALSLCAPSSLPGIHGGHGRHPRRHPELYGALGKRCVLSSCHGVQGTIGRCGLGKKVRQRVARLCCAHGVPVAAMALEAIASSFCEKQGGSVHLERIFMEADEVYRT